VRDFLFWETRSCVLRATFVNEKGISAIFSTQPNSHIFIRDQYLKEYLKVVEVLFTIYMAGLSWTFRSCEIIYGQIRTVFKRNLEHKLE